MKTNTLTLVALLSASVAFAAPVPELWPSKATRTAEGWDLSYDTSKLMKSSSAEEARIAFGPDRVNDLIRTLPPYLLVRLKRGTPLTISGGRGLEDARLASSFAAVTDVPMPRETEVGRPKDRLLPAFHPDAPKLLLSADAVFSSADRFVEAAFEGIESAEDKALSRVLERMVPRVAKLSDASGDEGEGATLLAAKIGAALACAQDKKIPSRLRQAPRVLTLVTSNVHRWAEAADVVLPPWPFSASPSLTCSYIRRQVLAEAFPKSRAGFSAVLIFLRELKADAESNAAWERAAAVRAQLWDEPKDEPLQAFRKSLPDLDAALADLAVVFEKLGRDAAPPPLLSGPSTPFTRFLGGLAQSERASAYDDFSAALSDGRINVSTTEPRALLVQRDAALLELGHADSPDVALDSVWRDRLLSLATVLGRGHRELRDDAKEAPVTKADRNVLKVVLRVPPMLLVEPLAGAYNSLSRSMELWGSRLKDDKKWKGLTAPSGESLVKVAERFARRARGLAKLSMKSTESGDPDVDEAEKFAAAFRTDASLSFDVRRVEVEPLVDSTGRDHVAVLGVGRRELVVGFAQRPVVSLVDATDGVELEPAEQHYLVPVLVPVHASRPGLEKPWSPSRLKSFIDAYNARRLKTEAAWLDAMTRK